MFYDIYLHSYNVGILTIFVRMSQYRYLYLYNFVVTFVNEAAVERLQLAPMQEVQG